VIYTRTVGEGPDLVLVHGWGLHSGVWDDLLERLTPRYRVTVVDLPGHGRSREAAGGPDLDRLAEQIGAVAPQSAAWLGWSLGGLVAMAVARRWSQRVSRLILVATTPRFVNSEDWDAGMDRVVFNGFFEDLRDDYRRTLERFVALQAGSDSESRRVIKALHRQLLRFGAPRPEALKAGLTILQDTDLRGELRGLSMPVQLIHGRRDRLASNRAAEYLAKALPNARLICMRGAGHAPFLSHPQEFAELVAGFMEGRGKPGWGDSDCCS